MATMATREMQREIKRELATRDKLLKLPRPKFDGFADRQRSHESFWGDPAMAVEICSDRRPCRALVTLYAEIGLHRYNLLHRTNFKFLRVEKYNYFIPLPITTYFITFLAIDPAASSHPQTFQTKVGEYVKTIFALSVYIARRLGDDDEENKTRSFYRPTNLPKWPPENQFYMPDASELQRYDWVRLYLQLAVAMTDRHEGHDLTKGFEMVKVAFDTQVEGLNFAQNATVYIRYKDSCVARVGKDVDRIAIVRRSFDELTGRFTVEGQSSPAPENDTKTLSLPFSPSNPVDFHDRLVLESSAAECSTAV